MTLEDFFTLTEMKDGFTTPSRVEELVSVMKKQKDSVVKSVSDATRQWTAVASTIAATENKDCLDLFIRSDGLWFLDKWLKDAQDFGNDPSDSFVEESITAMLRALAKLQIDTGASISSGIWITVKNLLSHNSSRVQDCARVLFDSWKGGKASDPVHNNIESSGVSIADGSMNCAKVTTENAKLECHAVDVSVLEGSSQRKNDEGDRVKVEKLALKAPDGLQPESAKDSCIGNSNDDTHSHKSAEHVDNVDTYENQVASSLTSKYPQEINSVLDEKLPTSTEEGTASSGTHSFAVSKNEVSDNQKLNELSNLEKHKSDLTASSTCKVEHDAASSGSGFEIVKDAVMDKHLEDKAGGKKSEQPNATSLAGVGTPEPEPKKGKDNRGSASHRGTQVSKTTSQTWSGSEFRQGEQPDELDTIISRLGNTAACDEDKNHTHDEGEGLRSGSRFPLKSRRRLSKRTAVRQNAGANKRTSDLEFECGIVDALEVARKVAQEVEGEVVDHREVSYSSSDELSEGGNEQLGTLDSINVKRDPPAVTPAMNASCWSVRSAGPGSEERRSRVKSSNLDKEPESGMPDMESSQATIAQELGPKTEKSLCGFDLNLEISSDDMEHPVDSLSTPVSVVSASRAAAAPGLPVAPLQFEGTLGWKGSAATSAFHPASPRRNSDSEKNLSGGRTSSSSKHRMDSLDIDLNVIEGEDDKAADIVSGKQILALSGHHSTESSLELSSKRMERFKLDLNRTSDDGDAPPLLDNRIEGQLFHNRNGHRSLSPASSSSSMQLSLRNIDLNDRPNVHNDSSDQGHGDVSFKNVNAYAGPKPNDPVISIMGTRVEVSRKGVIPQASSLPNGKAIETAMDGSVHRSGGVIGLGPHASYTHSPLFSYNGLTTATIYGSGGSIPYMVDSRGATVVPQLVGSASAVPSYSQPPFVMSMSNTGLGLNIGPSRSSFDLNSRFGVDGANRDAMGLRQSFMPAQARSMEGLLRANSQPSSSSVVSGKRKEPDGGWEPYPFNYRHHQFPWKQ